MRRLLTGALALVLSCAFLSTQPAGADPLDDAADLCARVGEKAGFTRTGNLTIAVAIALAESRCNPSAVHHNSNGSVDRGLWQINSIHTGVSEACAFNAECNAQAAYAISDKGTDWTPWTTYDTGAYQPFLNRAQAAVNRLGPPPRPVDRSEGDVTGDGYADLTTVDVDGRLVVFGNGILIPGYNGRPFQDRMWQTDNTNWGNDARSITTAEVTGDGYADFLVLTTSGKLQIYGNGMRINPGGAPFTGVYEEYDGWGAATHIAAGDVNHDGWADLAVTIGGQLQIYLNTRQTGPNENLFQYASWTYGNWGSDVTDIALGDVTGDAYADLAATRTDGTLTVYGNGILLPAHNGRPYVNPAWSVDAGWDQVHDITLSDVSGDGYADLTTVTTTGELQVYGNGILLPPGQDYFKYATWTYPGWQGVHHVA